MPVAPFPPNPLTWSISNHRGIPLSLFKNKKVITSAFRPLVGNRSKKSGLPPGTLVHLGESHPDTVQIGVISFDQQHVWEHPDVRVEQIPELRREGCINWINVYGVHDARIIQTLGSMFGVHPLVQEDILNTDHRPKFEDHDDYLFFTLRMLRVNGNREIINEQISMIVVRDCVISLQEFRGDVMEPLRERIRHGLGRVRKCQSDYLAYTIMDSIVDHYFVVLETLGDRTEEMEDDVLTCPEPGTARLIQKLRGDAILIRRAIWPLREVLAGIDRSENDLIQKDTRIYFRDVYDHTIQCMDAIETFREVLSVLMDLYLSSISNRLNDVMKTLTTIATIFMPLTLITGIYGMNFEHMPELQWKYGYLAFWIVLISAAGLMLYLFRKKRWLS
jgi:magnesium transporter